MVSNCNKGASQQILREKQDDNVNAMGDSIHKGEREGEREIKQARQR